ncbi:hypothetical protein EYF80_000376 [Liparis tanakae]|uniref:Uncharacterized protein n=1 Tax=Liparis tanakae TaxID=230148 RepID=A0A4Z2JHF9_9TELE|nr:hypothetical protein EYF80_000376 [Liparis tanakae]
MKALASSDMHSGTLGYFLHKDLDEGILTDGAQVLDDISVLQPLVQRYLLVKGLRMYCGQERRRRESEGTSNKGTERNVWKEQGRLP